MKNLIILPTYNESKNIVKTIDLVLAQRDDLNILIIDDNSPDGTADIVKDLNNEKIFIIEREAKKGLGSAYVEGFSWSLKNNYQKIIQMDADLSHDPSKIPIFLDALKSNSFVIGSRYIKGGRNETKLTRYLLSIIGNKIIKIVLNINCEEFTTSYRGFNINELKKFDINQVKSQGYSFFMETIYLIHKSGLGIKQIPIKFKHRQIGSSKIPKIEILRTLKNLFLIKFFKS